MLTALAALLLTTATHASAPAGDSSAALRAQAFDLAYNLDTDDALRLLAGGLAESPEDAGLHRAMASVLWLQMLFERGAVTVDHYLGSFTQTQVELKKPPPDLDARFRSHVARAIDLSGERVSATPHDLQARYDLGAAVGLRASHIATVEGKLFAGVRAARRAYDEHERVLRLDPARKDAGLTVGMYRYVVSTLSAPLRMMAYVAGFGGDRDRGIRMVEEAAAGGAESRTDAIFALVLLYNREQRYDDALRVLGELRRMYPRNRLIVLEAGSTALRAGRSSHAAALLTEGMRMLATDTRPLVPGEAALWHYKRGAARVTMNDADAARADLNVAIGPDAQDWVSGRAHAELARLAIRTDDRAGARTLAERAGMLCAQASDAPCAEDARKLLRSAGGR